MRYLNNKGTITEASIGGVNTNLLPNGAKVISIDPKNMKLIINFDNENLKDSYNFSDEMTFDEFKLKLEEYAKNSPYPNPDD